MSDNPLLTTAGTPRYRAIEAAHVEPAIAQRLEEFDALLEKLVADGAKTWATGVGYRSDSTAVQRTAGHFWKHRFGLRGSGG